MAASQLFPLLRNPNQQVVRPAVMVVIGWTDLKRHVVRNERLHALLRHEEVFERSLLLVLVSVRHRLTRLSADVADEDGLARHAGGFSERPLKIGLVGKVVNDRRIGKDFTIFQLNLVSSFQGLQRECIVLRPSTGAEVMDGLSWRLACTPYERFREAMKPERWHADCALRGKPARTSRRPQQT